MNKINTVQVSLSLSPHLCVHVGERGRGGGICVREDTETDRQRGKGGGGDKRVIRKQRLHELSLTISFHSSLTLSQYPAPSPSLLCTFTLYNWSSLRLKVVIYYFRNVDLISYLRLTLYLNAKSPVKMQTQTYHYSFICHCSDQHCVHQAISKNLQKLYQKIYSNSLTSGVRRGMRGKGEGLK